MMKRLPGRRALALLAVIAPLAALFIYVALRSGPLAPVTVTLATVESRAISPALFGIGTVEARETYRIGPTLAGRLKWLNVNVGDRVIAGQVIGEMEPIDLDDRIRSQEAAFKRADAARAEAQSRHDYAHGQARRYERLAEVGMVSVEVTAAKRQELQVAAAGLVAAREELAQVRAERAAITAQRSHLRLVAPVAGTVAARNADPGTTVVPGQPVVEIVDPGKLWINARFDQINAGGLATGLPAQVVLRSRNGHALSGRVLRVEPRADAVTEETLAKIGIDEFAGGLPPIGELAEATVRLPAHRPVPTIPNAAIHHERGGPGVWRVVDGDLRFVAIRTGAADLDGHVQVLEGLAQGDRIVLYSEKALTSRSRVRIADMIAGLAR